MSREKQIEEMCAIMADSSYVTCEDVPLVPESAGICDKVSCHRCKEERLLMNAGYRKSADVAREIFEEIEEGVKAAVSALQFENNPIHRQVKHETYSSLMRFIKTVEQKHTEEGK